MAKKIDRNGDGGRRSNFGLKLNVQVQYNMLRPIWPAPIKNHLDFIVWRKKLAETATAGDVQILA